MSPRAAIAVLGLALSLPALGCGHCVEDKIASVYDHALVVKSLGLGHHVAFFALEGKLAGGDAVRSAAQSAAGVDRGSVRISVDTATLSVTFDPKSVAFAVLERRLQRKLAPWGLSLLTLRLMERPAEFRTISSR